MLKSDLVAILVQKRDITQKQAELVVETIFESMKEALCKGDNIEIRGLGAFHVKNYAGYLGRNPKTSKPIQVRPKRGILFRTGKELRDRVNRAAAQQRAGLAVALDPEDEASIDSLNRDDDDRAALDPEAGFDVLPDSSEPTSGRSAGSLDSGLSDSQVGRGSAGDEESSAASAMLSPELNPAASESPFGATSRTGEERQSGDEPGGDAGGGRGPAGSAQIA